MASGSDTLSRPWWLFTPKIDLTVFLGSALISLGVLAGSHSFELYQIADAVVLLAIFIDMPHVWSTAFRVYLDPKERGRRPGLYYGAPLVVYLLSIVLYAGNYLYLFRTLAYLNMFHVIRQQYGWVALYRRRVGEVGSAGRWIDTVTAYTVTIYPLILWHSQGEKDRIWRTPGDTFPILPEIGAMLEPLYWMILGIYSIRSLSSWAGFGIANPGKDVVVFSTALVFNWCAYLGRPFFGLLIHGIPYLALVYWYSMRRKVEEGQPLGAGLANNLWTFLGSLWAMGILTYFVRESILSAAHLGMPYNPQGADLGYSLSVLLVPLAFLPPICHFLLDGFIWRGSDNPGLKIWD